MKRIFKTSISLLLIVTLILAATVNVFAAGETGEVYISELRLVYADSYREACNIIEDGEFYDYEVYKENLNESTDEIGVYLAYKTTTNIEEAITDIAVMQMNGGYNEGSYQDMIQRSEEEYFAMAQIYKEAIAYWKNAYTKGDFMAGSVLRQLNFYTIKDEDSIYNKKLLGNIMLEGMDQHEMATMFLQGNSYALGNIRSLLAMGVSYNEDGLHYLEKVEDCAASLDQDMGWYYDRMTEVDELVKLIIPAIMSIGQMFEELSLYEKDLNYLDDDVTDLELEYAEHKFVADSMRDVKYLDNKSLYDFCVEYERTRTQLEADGDYDEDDEDYTKFYPLVKALNEGQVAMTEVYHYYDVVRYSVSDVPQDVINTELEDMEDKYKENPFDVYAGVDRSIYEGSFALTSAAYRADANTKEGFASHWVHEETAYFASGLATAGVGTGLLVWGICRKTANTSSQAARDAAISASTKNLVNLKGSYLSLANEKMTYLLGNSLPSSYGATKGDVINTLFNKFAVGADKANIITFEDKAYYLYLNKNSSVMSNAELNAITEIKNRCDGVAQSYNSAKKNLVDAQQMTVSYASTGAKLFTGALLVVGGAMLIYSAVSLGISLYNYYNPDYDGVPVALVDLIDTVDGDRYIKYDVVYEAEARDGGDYAPGDTNAYTGFRWNALYYTKSYEAGHPLLAEFEHSDSSNVPEEDYAPIHRFGEVICYDLNKYQRNDYDAVYISVERSENHKAAVTDVPEVVGSIFSAGWVLLAGGVGALAGVGCTLGTQTLIKRKKSSAVDSADTPIETDQPVE